ncbi:Lipid A 1-diphosphate synthase [Arenibacter antarcticus]|uniref:Phosphatase PAP2 family protein n=1 Tax=Arenibacter antarcticus TaxID=2040469 RepID=A0ABW5VBR1_9FLAO|nr:phosphatase PAP2 family protein [Arenibacter sp. H213]MCM4167656.1 phosphoesterase [Arenibacter sp. H213]
MNGILSFKSLFFSLFFLLNAFLGTAQDTLSTKELLVADAKSAFGGLKYAYSRPLQWKSKDFLNAGAIILGSAALYTFDEDSSDWFRKQEDDVPGLLKETGYYLGKPLYNYSINGGVYLFGLFSKNEEIRRTGVLLLSASATVGIIQSISKTFVGRARPVAGLGKASFKPFSKEAGYHSFPSGHTILSFTTFYAIGKQFNNPWVKGGFYTLGMISPVSRLWSGAHWLTDVALSVAVSVVVVDSIDKFLKNSGEENKFSKNRISWNLEMGPGTIGFRGIF